MADIVLECNPDEVLARTLGYSKKQITHQPSKGEVFKYLERNHRDCGLVDEDPGSANPGYFSNYSKQGDTKFDIDYFVNKETGAKLIVLKPRLEEWILKQAEKEGIEPNEFSLPADGRALHKIINQRIPKFEQMLSKMKNGDALGFLRQLIG